MAAITEKRAQAFGGAETHFAKKLAHNEKKVRDKAVKKLRLWLSSSRFATSGLKELDMLKLWKGLFYCMWMSDKPKVQEELAEGIAQLIHNFHSSSSAFGFLAGFYKTIHREWHGIDRLRLDKFYMLIRKFVYHSILLLKNNNWDNEVLMGLNKVLEISSLCSPATSLRTEFAIGVQLHVIQVYFDELFKFDLSEMDSGTFLKLLQPFSNVLATTTSKLTLESISQNIFTQLLEKELSIKLDFSSLSEQLFTLASRNDIQARNRNMLYNFISKFKRVHNTKMDIALNNNEDVVPTDKCEKIDSINFELEQKAEKKSKKRKKALKQNGESHEFAVGSSENIENNPDVNQISEENIKSVEDTNVELNDQVPVERKVNKKANRKNSRKRKQNNECDSHIVELACSEMKGVEENKTLCEDKTTEITCKENEGKGTKKDKNKKNKRRKKEASTCPENKEDNESADDGSLNNSQSGLNNLDGSFLETISKDSNSESDVGSPTKVLQFTENENDSGVIINPVTNNEAAVTNNDENTRQISNDQIPDNLTPLRSFFRHSKKKANTEPRKTRSSTIASESKSASGKRKQVRIELSKNTCHTTQDYQRNLKCSPAVPFDADKKPVQSSLKVTPEITYTGRNLRSSKRLKAADFF